VEPIKAQKEKGQKKRKVVHVHIEKAANGFTVGHRREPMKTRAPGGAMVSSSYEEPPKDAVFSGDNAQQQAMDHVGSLMGQMGDNQEPDQQA
jgi:hypothetical protein